MSLKAGRVRRRFNRGPAGPGALFYFAFYGSGAVYIPFLTVFFSHRGLTGSEIGLLTAIGPLMSLLLAPPLTALADRRGWRVPMLCTALAANALCLFAVPVPSNFEGLLPVVALLFAVGSPIGPLADGLIAHLAAQHNLAFGQMRLWGSLSWAVAAVVCGALWQEQGFSLMFPLAAVLFFSMVPVARLLKEDRLSGQGERLPFRLVLADRRLRVLLVASLVLGLGMATVATFSGIYLDRVGGGQLLVGLFSCVTALSELPVMHFSERLAERFGGLRTLLMAYVFTALSYAGMAWSEQPAILLGMAVLQGLGFGLFLPVTVRLVAAWSPPEWIATSQGLLTGAVWGLAPLLAGPAGGALFDAAGASSVFLISAAVGLLAALVLVLGLRAQPETHG